MDWGRKGTTEPRGICSEKEAKYVTLRSNDVSYIDLRMQGVTHAESDGSAFGSYNKLIVYKCQSRGQASCIMHHASFPSCFCTTTVLCISCRVI